LLGVGDLSGQRPALAHEVRHLRLERRQLVIGPLSKNGQLVLLALNGGAQLGGNRILSAIRGLQFRDPTIQFRDVGSGDLKGSPEVIRLSSGLLVGMPTDTPDIRECQSGE
jgi:hypothetical protein